MSPLLLLLLLFVSHTYATEEEIEAVKYPTLWRASSFYLKAGCNANDLYWTIEDPFDTCLTYVNAESKKEESFMFSDHMPSAAQYNACYFTDKMCTMNKTCEMRSTACAQQELAPDDKPWISISIGPRKNIGRPAMFAQWKYFQYGGNNCSSGNNKVDEDLEITLGQCIKFTTLDEWSDNEARFCAFKDPKCTDNFPYQCTIVKQKGCYATAKGESYNSTVLFVKPTAKPGSASSLAMSLVAIIASICIAWM